MREVMGYTDDLPPLPPQRTPLPDANRRTNDIIVNALRSGRENFFCERLRRIFAARPLELDPQLPLPSPEKDPSRAPWLLSIEHLQDVCNKTMAIYSTYTQYTSEKLYKFLFDQWVLSHGGDVHKVDLEFARFFAKLICIRFQNGPATKQELLPIHQALCEASTAAKHAGFEKEVDEQYKLDSNEHFLAGHQTEFYNIKPLYKALFMVIEKQIPENETNFELQKVRLVRTGYTTGLIYPITFEGLDILEKINEDEVVTTLPKAYRFVMDLDQMEGTWKEKRNEKILDHWLGIPKVQLQMWYNANKPGNKTCYWTGGLEEIPEGPSTTWWTDGLPTLSEVENAARAKRKLEERKIAPMKDTSWKKESPMKKSPFKASSKSKEFMVEEWRSGPATV
jgi:hypothetical protein